MVKVPSAIKKAKDALELELAELIHMVTNCFHEQYPEWVITDTDIGIIDISTMGETKRMTAACRVELTRTDGKLKICLGGQVKESKERDK